MRDGKYGLRTLFRIISLCGSLLAAAHYGVFWLALFYTALAVLLGCIWYAAMRRAPEPTLYLTITVLLVTPSFAILAVSLQHSREAARRAQAIESLRGGAADMLWMRQSHPELERAGSEELNALLQELLRQRSALGLGRERQRGQPD